MRGEASAIFLLFFLALSGCTHDAVLTSANPAGASRSESGGMADESPGGRRADAGFERAALQDLFGEMHLPYVSGAYLRPMEDLQAEWRTIRGGLTFHALKPKLNIYRGYAETILRDWNAHGQGSPDRAPAGTEYIMAFVLHAPLTPGERVKWARRAVTALLKTRNIVITRESADREGPALARKLSSAHRILLFAGDQPGAERLYEDLLRHTDSVPTMILAAAYSGFSLEFWQQTFKPKLIRLFALDTAQPRPVPPLLADQVARRLVDRDRIDEAAWLVDAAVRAAGLAVLGQAEWRPALARWLEVHDLLQTSQETDAVLAQLPALVRVRARYAEVAGLKRIRQYDRLPGLLVQLIQEAKRARLTDDEFCCADPYGDLLGLLVCNPNEDERIERIADTFKACPPAECANEEKLVYCAALIVFQAGKYEAAAELFERNTRGRAYAADDKFMAALSWALAGRPEKAVPLYQDVATAKPDDRRSGLQALGFTTDPGMGRPVITYRTAPIDIAKTARLHARILQERLPIAVEWHRRLFGRGILTGVDPIRQTIAVRQLYAWLNSSPDDTVAFSELSEPRLQYVRQAAPTDDPADIERMLALAIPYTMRASGYRPPSDPLTPFREEPRWENTLGMIFVRIPATDLWFSIWETRLQDSFARLNYRVAGGLDMPAYPATELVGTEKAIAFCKWLTLRETTAGRLPAGFYYRLPTQAEWSHAAGIDPPPGLTPAEWKTFYAEHFPWGTQWPPPPGSGNYAGEEIASVTTNELYNIKGITIAADWKAGLSALAGHRDPYPGLAPVGSFPPNAYGLYDMAGNAAETLWDAGVVGGSCADAARGGFVAAPYLMRDELPCWVQPHGYRLVLARRPPGPPAFGVQPLVPGRAWTNSLGMMFRWVEALAMWALDRDVTVEDLQMLDPWRCLGPNDAYSRWQDGETYAAWLTGREHESRALPEAYEYRAAMQKELTALGMPTPAFNRRLAIYPLGAGKDAPPAYPPPVPWREPAPLASRKFKWQYSMDVGAETQDLDRSGKGDFWDGGPDLPTVEQGIAGFDVGDRYRTDFAGSITRRALKRNGNCTVEVRVRVHPDSREGLAGVLAVALRDQDNSSCFLYIGKRTVKYFRSLEYPEEGVPVVAEGDNTDGFHTFRIARISNPWDPQGLGTARVWRDGILLKDATSDLYLAGADGLTVGDNGPAVEGSFDLDYIRIHDEATCPPSPAPGETGHE